MVEDDPPSPGDEEERGEADQEEGKTVRVRRPPRRYSPTEFLKNG